MAGSGDSSGSWLMTYADFITLMMIFFIVLYTFTPGVEQNKFEAIIGAFKGKQGVLRFESVFSDEQLDIKIQRAKNWEEFQEFIQQKDLDGKIQLEMMPDGILITLGESVTFGTYSAELVSEAQIILKKIGETLFDYKAEELKEIEILGHTDSRPVKINARLYENNWELGSARALSVLNFFVDSTRMNPGYFKASTFGQYRPKVDNDTEKAMQKNRRVEIYIRYKKPELQSKAEEIPVKPEKEKQEK